MYKPVFLQFIFNKTLQTASELSERYTFPILGEFLSDKAKTHKKFGQWLDKLIGDVQTLPDDQQVYELVAAGIRASVVELPVKLVITGTVEEIKLKEIGNTISKLLPEGYIVEIASNPVYNAKFLANLKQYEILLVEAKGVSQKPEIAKLVDMLQRNEIKIVGSVII